VRELTADDPELANLAEALLSVIEVMMREVGRLTMRMLDEARTEPTCRRLMTVPSVGPLTALAFRAIIDQPDRFRKSRDVGAHLGLTPRRSMVRAARVGPERGHAARHGARPRRRRSQARGDPAPHVGRRQCVPLEQASRGMSRGVPVSV
jgi:transposase